MSHEQINQQRTDEEEHDEWEVLRDHPDYEICTEYPYQTRNISTHRILKETLATDGYVTVTLNKKSHFKHRLVALQFIPNPDPERLLYINHKNHVRNDNRIDNLEWMTRGQNQTDLSRTKNGREVDYVNELPDSAAVVVNKYNGCTFNSYYYADDRFFKQRHNGKYRVIPWCHSGRNGVCECVSLTDVDNVPHHINKKKFMRQYKDDQSETNPSNIIEFMDKYFEDIERIELSTVAAIWERFHGIVKQSTLSDMLKDAGLYQITNSHNKRYVNRI